MEKGLNYLGCYIKPNDYRIVEWTWLVQKVEKMISNWGFKWLSLGGRLVLAKMVL